MKKFTKIAIVALLTVSLSGSVFAISACGNTDDTKEPVQHTHTYSAEWSSDDTYHWHAATCGHSVQSDKAEHIWDEGVTEGNTITYTCTVCDRTKTEEAPPQVGEGETMYTFEAEYAPFDSMADCGTPSYPGYSNSATGAQVIAPDITDLLTGTNLGAVADDYQKEHNKDFGFDDNTGWFVSYMYIEGATIRFYITAEADTTATLYLRYAGQVEYTLTYDKYQVVVNDTMLEYDDIELTGSYNKMSEFKTIELGEVELKKGENVIQLITANSDTPESAGRWKGIAPVVDSISLASEVDLAYTEGHKLVENLEASQAV